MKTICPLTESGSKTGWIIVDNSEDRSSLFRDIFSRFGDIRIELFNAPQDAIAAFEAEPKAFDFVLTDLEMPGMGGFELTRRLRPLSPALKVFLSIWDDLLSAEEAVEKGFCDRVHKPFPFAALQKAVAPASLKYVEQFAGVTSGLNLVPAY